MICTALIEHDDEQRVMSGQDPPLFIAQQHDPAPKRIALTPVVMKATFSNSARVSAGRTG